MRKFQHGSSNFVTVTHAILIENIHCRGAKHLEKKKINPQHNSNIAPTSIIFATAQSTKKKPAAEPASLNYYLFIIFLVYWVHSAGGKSALWRYVSYAFRVIVQ